MGFNWENKKRLHFARFNALKVHFNTIPLKVNIGPRLSCVGGGLRSHSYSCFFDHNRESLCMYVYHLCIFDSRERETYLKLIST